MGKLTKWGGQVNIIRWATLGQRWEDIPVEVSKLTFLVGVPTYLGGGGGKNSTL